MVHQPWASRVPLGVAAISSHDVGVLYIVYTHGSSFRSNATTKRYLSEAISSSQYSRQQDPSLATALATNMHVADEKAFSVVAYSLPADTSAMPTWMPRLMALAASPFELTLALDAHAVVCTAGLHAALLREHRLNRFDLAFNIEATLGLSDRRTSTLWSWLSGSQPPLPWRSPNRPGRDVAPRAIEELLPHNWALLVRRGPAGLALLERWASSLTCAHCGWANHQYASYALSRLPTPSHAVSHLLTSHAQVRPASSACVPKARRRHPAGRRAPTRDAFARAWRGRLQIGRQGDWRVPSCLNATSVVAHMQSPSYLTHAGDIGLLDSLR